MIEIVPEHPDMHAEAIEALYDATFGPGHFAKTAERLRERNRSLPEVSRVALLNDHVIAVCRLWPVIVGEYELPAVFVGPVAVDPEHQGRRLGLTVTKAALDAAKAADWPAAVIIGSPVYFQELGFETVSPDRFSFPGPQDMSRVMVLELAGSTEDLCGAVRVA